MTYNFDEIIDRRGTNAENIEGFRSYLFGDEPDITFPFPDEEMLRMWVADMEFAVAPEIRQAMKDRLDRKILGYTGAFGDDYYRAFSGWCRDRYDWSFPQEELVFSPGVIPALYELAGDLVGADEKLMFTTPSYGFFRHAAEYAGREYVCSPLKDDNGYFRIDFQDLEKKAADPKMKALIWCNPHNPTGRVWKTDEAERVAEIVERHGLWIISDEIHCDILRTGKHHTPMAKIMPDYPKLITCMSPSKTFNMAGNLFSNIIIRDENLRNTFRKNDKLGGSLNPLSLTAAQAAYEKGYPWLREMKAYLDGNFDFTEKFIAENIPGAVFRGAESTYLAWVDLNACPVDRKNPARFFATKAGVLLEGGDRLFVGNADGFVRLNLAMPRSVLGEGLRRIAGAVNREQVHG